MTGDAGRGGSRSLLADFCNERHDEALATVEMRDGTRLRAFLDGYVQGTVGLVFVDCGGRFVGELFVSQDEIERISAGEETIERGNEGWRSILLR